MKRKIACKVSLLLTTTIVSVGGFSATFGSIPSSRYQYAEDCEYESLLALPWVSRSTRKVNVEFRCPKCMESAEVAKMYRDTSLYNGTVKVAGGNVVMAFQLQVIPDDLSDEFHMIRFAREEETRSPAFFRKFSSLTGRKDVVEMGFTKVGGLNALWTTTKMERRVGNGIVYRGVNRMYMIPLKNSWQVLSASILVGAMGVDEIPYADFKAFLPVGEKFIKSITIKEKPKWKFW